MIVSGILLDVVGNPLANTTIQIVSTLNTIDIIDGTDSVIKTSDDGSYYFELVTGRYDVYVHLKRCGDVEFIGTGEVNDDTPDGTLNQLIGTTAIIYPPAVDAAIDAAKEAVAAKDIAMACAKQTEEDRDAVAKDKEIVTEIKDSLVGMEESLNESHECMHNDIQEANSIKGEIDNTYEKVQKVELNVSQLEVSAKESADLSSKNATETGKHLTEIKQIQSDVTNNAEQVSIDAAQVAKDAAQANNDAAQVAKDAEQVSTDAAQVSQDKDQVSKDAEQVSIDAAQVAKDAEQVSIDAAQVSQDKDQVRADTVIAERAKEAAICAATEAVEISGIKNIDEALTLRLNEFTAHAVHHASSSKMKYIRDCNGNYNLMVSIPCFTFDDLGLDPEIGKGVHPAFLRKDGTVIPEIWVGAYSASKSKTNNFVTVQSNAEPYGDVSNSVAISECKKMGKGWHLMTILEWAAVALWCLANNYQPTGNTEKGRSHEKKHQVCRRVDGLLPNDLSGKGYGFCGTGPNEWRHDGTAFGISDLVGNAAEHIYGCSVYGGIIYVEEYPQQPEKEWKKATSKPTGRGGVWGDMQFYGDDELLKQALIQPSESTKGIKGNMFFASSGRYPLRGGYCQSNQRAGLAAIEFKLKDEHHTLLWSTTFRPVFVEE